MPRPPARGFTLVEMMVVTFLVALLAAAVMLTLPGSGSLPREVDRFAARLDHARDEAIIGMRAVRVVVDAAGYRFERQHLGQWELLRDGPFEPVPWSDGTRPELVSDQPLSFVFDLQGGAGGAAALAFTDGRERLRVAVDPDGEVHVE